MKIVLKIYYNFFFFFLMSSYLACPLFALNDSSSTVSRAPQNLLIMLSGVILKMIERASCA